MSIKVFVAAFLLTVALLGGVVFAQTLTPTDTPMPTVTETPIPTATDTPMPTATMTPSPTPTPTGFQPGVGGAPATTTVPQGAPATGLGGSQL